MYKHRSLVESLELLGSLGRLVVQFSLLSSDSSSARVGVGFLFHLVRRPGELVHGSGSWFRPCTPR